MAILLSACASPAASTSAPITQAEPGTASQPVEGDPAALTPPPTTAPTPVPPQPHWYWGVDADTQQVIAVNQFGDSKELGDLDHGDDIHTTSVSLDAERALLFLDSDENLRLYLLTPDAVKKIAMPSNPYYFNTDFSQGSRMVIAFHGDTAVFSYVTQDASNRIPGAGPLFAVDLKSLTAKLVDKDVSRESYGDNRHWFHASRDGRYLRYLNSDQEKIEIRELDLASGEARTIYTTGDSSFGIYASPQGDLWYLRNSDLILDLNGNQTDFTDESLTVRPLGDGKALVFPRECPDQCEVKVIAPFRPDAELTYTLPWATQSQTTGYFELVSQALPDQSLLFAGWEYLALSEPPAAVQEYPDLREDDPPLFRLTPDGEARLVGIYAGGISADGRYMALKSADQASFFIYDASADRPLFSMPAPAGLDYIAANTRYFDAGILVELAGSVPGTRNSDYRFFYHAYSYETSTTRGWEDVTGDNSACPSLLEDGSLVCWSYRTDTLNYDLVRFDPAAGTKVPLIENVWFIDFIQ